MGKCFPYPAFCWKWEEAPYVLRISCQRSARGADRLPHRGGRSSSAGADLRTGDPGSLHCRMLYRRRGGGLGQRGALSRPSRRLLYSSSGRPRDPLRRREYAAGGRLVRDRRHAPGRDAPPRRDPIRRPLCAEGGVFRNRSADPLCHCDQRRPQPLGGAAADGVRLPDARRALLRQRRTGGGMPHGGRSRDRDHGDRVSHRPSGRENRRTGRL